MKARLKRTTSPLWGYIGHVLRIHYTDNTNDEVYIQDANDFDWTEFSLPIPPVSVGKAISFFQVGFTYDWGNPWAGFILAGLIDDIELPI